jgi:hypothetical protein
MPVVYFLLSMTEFSKNTPWERYAIALGITAPLVMAGSYLLFSVIERLGISLGRSLIRYL